MPHKPKPLPPLITKLGCYPHPTKDLHLQKASIRGRAVTLQARALHSLQEKVYPALHKAGIGLVVVSSYRSCALQRQLCIEHGCSPVNGCPGIIAGPGRSGHNIGICVDIYPPAPKLIARYRATFAREGWHNFSGSGGSDPNHWSYRVTV